MRDQPRHDRMRAPNDAGRTGRVVVLGANYLSSFAVGVAVGGITPFLTLVMEQRGVAEVVIGANTAAGSLGIICVAPFVPTMVRRLGLGVVLVGGIVVSVVAFLMMSVFESIFAWCLLRFAFAGGLGVHWVVSETWLNAIASTRDRGRIMSLYVTAVAAGFATGPIVLGLIGTASWIAFPIFALFTALALLPLVLVLRHAPRLSASARGTPVMLARAAPTIFAAVVATGLFTGACFTFLPIYGMRLGLGAADAVFLLTCFVAGNLIFQVPAGWLADRFNHRLLLLVFAVIAIAAPPLLPVLLPMTIAAAFLLAVWGGAVFAIYTVGIVMLGARFETRGLAAANAAFVMTFESASVLGPVAAGAAIALWAPHGMLVFLVAVAGLFAAVIVLRGVRGRDPA